MRRREKFRRVFLTLASRERAVTASLAARPTVSGAHRLPERRDTMRRITPLILVLVAMATAAFPLAASATHGPPHGGRAVTAM
jgi:hypothetical protein